MSRLLLTEPPLDLTLKPGEGDRQWAEPPCQARGRLLQPARHGRAAHQGRQERNCADPALSCRRFRNTAVRLRLHALVCNPVNFIRTPGLPEAVRRWSPTGVKETPIRIGAGMVTHEPVRHVPVQLARLAEGAVPGGLFAEILRLIAELRPQPAPA